MPVHPYRELWETRDLGSWADALSDDVTMYSPMFKTPFKGRETAMELFEVLLATLQDFEITEQFSDHDTHAFFWRATAAGNTIEGADLIRHDVNHKIVEIRVLIRPLVGIAAFGEVMGPPLARRRGRSRGWIAAVVSKPLRMFLGIVDAVATRLVRRG